MASIEHLLEIEIIRDCILDELGFRDKINLASTCVTAHHSVKSYFDDHGIRVKEDDLENYEYVKEANVETFLASSLGKEAKLISLEISEWNLSSFAPRLHTIKHLSIRLFHKIKLSKFDTQGALWPILNPFHNLVGSMESLVSASIEAHEWQHLKDQVLALTDRPKFQRLELKLHSRANFHDLLVTLETEMEFRRKLKGLIMFDLFNQLLDDSMSYENDDSTDRILGIMAGMENVRLRILDPVDDELALLNLVKIKSILTNSYQPCSLRSLTYCSDLAPHHIFDVLTSYCPQLRHLTLTLPAKRHSLEPPVYLLDWILSSCPNLISLEAKNTLVDVSSEGFHQLEASNKNYPLRKIRCIAPDINDLIYWISRTCQGIRSIDVGDGSDLDEPFSDLLAEALNDREGGLSQLSTLIFDGVDLDEVESLLEVSQRLPSLQTVGFRVAHPQLKPRDEFITSGVEKWAAECFQSLAKLRRIIFKSSFSDDNATAIYQRLPDPSAHGFELFQIPEEFY